MGTKVLPTNLELCRHIKKQKQFKPLRTKARSSAKTTQYLSSLTRKTGKPGLEPTIPGLLGE